MALTKDDLKIGNVVYQLDINNNVARRKKLVMIDSEGNEWYRYDKELWTYTVIPMKICGSVKHIIRGMVHEHGCDVEDEWHLMYLTDNPDERSIDYYGERQLADNTLTNWTQFFLNEDAAIAAGESFCVNKNSA